MPRLTVLSTRVMPAALTLTMFAGPALAQPTPQPARANTLRPMALPPGGLLQPTGQPNAVAPTPAPPGQGRAGQATTPPAAAPRPEAPGAPYLSGPTVPAGTNIRLELAITDTYTGAPAKKTVSLLVLTGNSGMIRTNNFGDGGIAILNVDAIALAYQNGQVSVRMTFEYTPARAKEAAPNTGRPPTLNESITVVLQDGKTLMVSQSADPATDRKVTAELTATILK